MSKPSSIVTWADGGSALVVQPTATKRAAGFGPAEEPPAEFHNAILRAHGEWLTFEETERQAFQSRMFDGILRRMAPNLDTTLGLDPEFPGQADMVTSPYVFVPNPGQAFPYQGSANNKIKIAPGTIIQRLTGMGADPSLLAYTFDGTEAELSIANGDATNPRVDIVQVALAYNSGTSSTTLTINVKQGTPAASPLYPAPDAGFVVLCGVVVGANYVAAAGFKYDDTAGAVAVLHDQRMPLGVRAFDVMPGNFIYTSEWVPTTVNFGVKKTGAGTGNSLVIVCPLGATGRVVAVAQGVLDKTTLNSHLSKINWIDSGGSGMTGAYTDMNGANLNGSGSNAYHFKTALWRQVENLHTPAAGPTVLINATTKMGAPVWTNGKRAPRELVRLDSSNAPEYTKIGLRWLGVTSDQNSEWGPAVWYVAGGL